VQARGAVRVRLAWGLPLGDDDGQDRHALRRVFHVRKIPGRQIHRPIMASPILHTPLLSVILQHEYRSAPFDALLVAVILVYRPLLCDGPRIYEQLPSKNYLHKVEA